MKKISCSIILMLLLALQVATCSSSRNESRQDVIKPFSGKELLYEGVNRIYIEQVTDRSINPLIPETLASSLKKRISLEGRLKVVESSESSDVILKVNITGFISEPVNFDSAGLPEKKRLRIDTRVSLIYTSGGYERIKQYEVYTESTYMLTGISARSEYREISDLTDQLSIKIISVISTGWYKEK